MVFWIFMFIMNLLIPIIMIGFGKVFLNNPPAEINSWYGYRTSMSRKNKDTWDFAHHYCGKIWVKCGWITLILSTIIMLFLIGKGIKVVGIGSGIVSTLQCVVLLGSIIPTEIALKKKFDKNGNLR